MKLRLPRAGRYRAKRGRHREVIGPNCVEMLHGSPWFDAAWYREQYRDLCCSSGDPARHYLERGEAQGCRPSPWFDPVDYRCMYPDVAAADVSPLLHFLQHGCAEGRLPRRLQAEAVEGRMWESSDFAGSFAELQALSEADDALEAAWATWALARWYGWQDDWAEVVRRSAVLRESPAPYPSHPAVWLLEAEALSRQGRLRAAFATLEALARRWPDPTDGPLARSNLLAAEAHRLARNTAAEVVRFHDDLRLGQINHLWRTAGLSELRPAEPTAPLSMDHLAPLDPVPRERSSVCDAALTVSVIVPVFNSAETLATALASLSVQSWSALEVIVVDDASTDDSRAVAEAFAAADPRFRVVTQPTNQGAYAARNRGLSLASGELMTTHDSDDWSHPDKIARQVEGLRAHPEWLACTSHWVRCSADLWFGAWRVEHGRIDYGWSHRNISSLMFRRDVFAQLGYWDRVRVEADTEYYLRIQAAFGSQAMGEVLPGLPLAFGRHREDSLSQEGATRLVTQLAGWRRDYREAATAWHAGARQPEDLYLPDGPTRRPFPIPGHSTE